MRERTQVLEVCKLSSAQARACGLQLQGEACAVQTCGHGSTKSRECHHPAATSMTRPCVFSSPASLKLIGQGVNRSSVSPTPSWPKPLKPQARGQPCSVRARECLDPADTCVVGKKREHALLRHITSPVACIPVKNKEAQPNQLIYGPSTAHGYSQAHYAHRVPW
eukprot:1161080-Pelagomonas_calceolata.AAC.9